MSKVIEVAGWQAIKYLSQAKKSTIENPQTISRIKHLSTVQRIIRKLRAPDTTAY